MPLPYNYSINIPNPVQGVMEGLNLASQINVRDETAQQKQLAIDKARQEMLMQKQYMADVTELNRNPTTQGIIAHAIKYPGQSKEFDKVFNALSAQEKQASLSKAIPVHAAALSGDNETALRLIEEQALAAENSGKPDEAKAARTMAELIKKNPSFANIATSQMLASAMGPEKYAETFAKFGEEGRAQALAPSKLKEEEAKATSAAVAAKFAESKAVQELEKTGWDINKIQNDIEVSKQNARIAAANVALSRENNALERQKIGIKVQEMEAARDEKINTKTREIKNYVSNVDNMISTLTMALETPKNVREAATGVVEGRLPPGAIRPWLAQEVNDYRSIIETIRSQNMLQQLKDLKATGATMGALNLEEGKALTNSLVNLSTSQSERVLQSNLKEAKRLLLKSRGIAIEKYGVPDTPVDYRAGVGKTPTTKATTQPQSTFQRSEVEALAAKRGTTPESLIAEIEARGGKVQ